MKDIDITPEMALAQISEISPSAKILVEIFKGNSRDYRAGILYTNPLRVAVFGANTELQTALSLHESDTSHNANLEKRATLYIYDTSYTYPGALDASALIERFANNPHAIFDHSRHTYDHVAEIIAEYNKLKTRLTENTFGTFLGYTGERFFNRLCNEAVQLQSTTAPLSGDETIHLSKSSSLGFLSKN